MCRYCSVLQEIRRKEREQFNAYKEKYIKEFKKDNFLLKRCIIALNWKENKELVNDIFKTIGGEGLCITHLEEQRHKQKQST